MSQARHLRAVGAGGFALLVLLAIVGVGSLAIVLALPSTMPPGGGQAVQAEANVAAAQVAARIGYRRNGAFPASLTQAATVAGLDATGAWRVDPWGRGADLQWTAVTGGLRVRSCGRDGRFGTTDDTAIVVATDTQLRLRTRARLRLLRAVLARSAYRWSPTMSTNDQTSMRTAMRAYAVARRSWSTADTTTRAALTATMASASTTVATLVAANALPALPNALVGAAGLMQQLGIDATRAVDGRGVRLLRDAVVGVVASGADRRGGTDDDM